VVESETEKGSVQLYPRKALKLATVAPPVNPATTFTHLRDAGGSRVPVIFDYGPFKLPTEPKERGIYRWRVMGKHRLKGCDLTGGNGEPQLFYEDGTSPYYPQIRLIRDTKSESAPG